MIEVLCYIYFITAVIYIIFILFCRIGWRRIPLQQLINYNPSTSVSIIIPARNEEQNILNCLEDLVKQDYPSALFEVIIVDDASCDETAQLVNEFIAINPDKTFRLVQLKEIKHIQTFKKRAITQGIEAARGQLIITTDADCRVPLKWISAFVQHFETTKASMIAGPVCFYKEQSILEKMQSLEFIGLIGIGAGSIHNHLPVMCNGANLAYSKEIFHEVNGFEVTNNIASGDDTQLMLKITAQNKGKIHFLKSQNAIVYTSAKNSLADLFQQRKRWVSKIPGHTSAFTLFIAVSAYLFNAGIIISVLWMILSLQFSWLLFLPFACKFLFEFIFLFDVSIFFHRKKLLWLFLPAQFIYPLYIIMIGAIAPFGTYLWKERRVK